MADEQPNPDAEIKVEVEDPEYAVEEHVSYKRHLQVVNRQLTKLLRDNVSEFRLIMNGSSYAFTKLTLSNRGLQQVNEQICEYAHLRDIDLSSNLLTDLMYLHKLNYINKLNLSRNLISDSKFLANESDHPYLLILNLANNKINELGAIGFCKLKHLNLNSNLIVTLEYFEGHTCLEVLELRGNKIHSLKGLRKVIRLTALYLADNQISNLEGLADLPKLERLHLRKNKLNELIVFPQLPSLKYLNLRDNQIGKLDSLSGILRCVQILNLLGNPVSEELGDNTKKEVWMRYRHYTKINKNEVSNEDKEEFYKEYKDRLAEQQRERAEKEAADKEAREAAEREAADKQAD